MNLGCCKKIPLWRLFISLATALACCSDINNSWEIKGGGYFNYHINNGEKNTIKLGKDDCEPPYYVNNAHHYFLLRTQLEESDRGDQFSILVNRPTTGTKLRPEKYVTVNGNLQNATWMRQRSSITSPLIEDSSYIKFDEIIPDSLWTASVNLFFVDCSDKVCDEDRPPIHVTGRIRYYVPADER